MGRSAWGKTGKRGKDSRRPRGHVGWSWPRCSLLWASLAVSSLGQPRALLGINRCSTLANHVGGIC